MILDLALLSALCLVWSAALTRARGGVMTMPEDP